MSPGLLWSISHKVDKSVLQNALTSAMVPMNTPLRIMALLYRIVICTGLEPVPKCSSQKSHAPGGTVLSSFCPLQCDLNSDIKIAFIVYLGYFCPTLFLPFCFRHSLAVWGNQWRVKKAQTQWLAEVNDASLLAPVFSLLFPQGLLYILSLEKPRNKYEVCYVNYFFSSLCSLFCYLNKLSLTTIEMKGSRTMW